MKAILLQILVVCVAIPIVIAIKMMELLPLLNAALIVIVMFLAVAGLALAQHEKSSNERSPAVPGTKLADSAK